MKLADTTQRIFELFWKLLRDQGIKAEDVSSIEYAGAVVRAAVEAGWIDYDVDNADPKDVYKLFKQINAYTLAVMSIDPQ